MRNSFSVARITFSEARLSGSPITLPATDGARDPAGDGGAMDETADMLDIALSARAVGGGGARLPVWITGTLLGPGVGA